MTKEDLEQLAAGYRNHRGEFININNSTKQSPSRGGDHQPSGN